MERLTGVPPFPAPRGKEKKKGTKHVRAWNVRYGKEWFINPDILIGMYQDDDLRLIKRIIYRAGCRSHKANQGKETLCLSASTQDAARK